MRRFVRLRQHAVAKLSALTFLLLIVLPFTAPFPTYQLDTSHGTPYDVPVKEFKNKVDPGDNLILPLSISLLLPARDGADVSPAVRGSQFSDPPVHHAVLRL